MSVIDDRAALQRRYQHPDLQHRYPVAVADGRTLVGAMRLKEKESFAFWDAMLVEAARASGVTCLLSEDMQDGRMVGALRLKNPFKEGFDLSLDRSG